MPPRRRFAVPACMDVRLDPAKAPGLEEGDACVVRNAGGRAGDDALRSLVISRQLLGTREVIVVHHSDRGMVPFTNEQLRHKLRDTFGVDARDRDDVAAIRSSPLIPAAAPVHGFVYDVRTGRLREVVEGPDRIRSLPQRRPLRIEESHDRLP